MLSLVNSSRVGGAPRISWRRFRPRCVILRTYKEIQQREFSNEPEGYKTHERDAVGRGGQGTRLELRWSDRRRLAGVYLNKEDVESRSDFCAFEPASQSEEQEARQVLAHAGILSLCSISRKRASCAAGRAVRPL